MNTALQPLHNAIAEGRCAFLMSGRNLRDLDVYADQQRMGPLLEILRTELRDGYGMVLITYSLAEGVDYDPSSIEKEKDREKITTVLRSHNLLDIPQDDQEVAHIVRGVARLCRTPTQGLTWVDNKPMGFCFLLFFGEHLVPQCSQGGQSNAQIVATELSHITAQSLALRRSGNLLCFHVQEASLVDPLVRSALYPICLPQPDRHSKQVFVQVAKNIYNKANLATDLTWENIPFLTSNTPNQGLEALLRASHRTGRPLTARELVAQKSLDVQAISEQTLTVLDTTRISADSKLQGINSSFAQTILQQLAKALAVGNSAMPANVLLVGPPGTGKTEMSMIIAKQAGVAAYQMHSPKTGIVGETERKAELQQRVLREWTPNLAFVDEITEALPLERSDFNGDSGATRAVTAALLTALADESRRGQSLLIATTNCPWRMGAAMRSRFVAIPVLQPLPEDYPAIVQAIGQKLGGINLTPQHPAIIEAAAIFARKGANPRHIRAALSNALLIKENLTPEAILFSAQDLSITTDTASAIYSDLWAIKACSSKSFLPWNHNLTAYPFPKHLQGLVNLETGEINQTELDQRIEDLKPHANL
ncbi:MAG: ATP-binding protein [Sphaerospermopsis kisseleviana]